YPTWRSPGRSGRFTGVRWVGLAACVLISTASAAPRSSNPAFLGIQMHDTPSGCQIDFATQDGPAEAAGLRRDEVGTTVDGKPTANCSVLLAAITSHRPGDAVEIKVQRYFASAAPAGTGGTFVARAQLTTRDALLQRIIGKPMAETHFV